MFTKTHVFLSENTGLFPPKHLTFLVKRHMVFEREPKTLFKVYADIFAVAPSAAYGKLK